MGSAINRNQFLRGDFSRRSRPIRPPWSLPEVGLEEDKTCIDCHKGVAHSLPDMHEVDPTVVVGEL